MKYSKLLGVLFMKLFLRVVIDNTVYCYSVLNGVSYNCIHFPNHFVIYLYKHHNHLYSYKAFFYNSLRISFGECNSKIKLYNSIQFLLKEELYDVMQF